LRSQRRKYRSGGICGVDGVKIAMTIEPEETDIVGQWVVQDGRVIADEATRRIELLIKEHLEIVAACGWEQLFLDPTDGRFWERTFPKSEMHGGGPPRLTVIDEEKAHIKYHFDLARTACAPPLRNRE
jgi:hypothetical protein